jgi:hypothetical protein
MKKNIGGVDKMIRVILAVIAGILVYFEVVEDTLAYILLAVAAISVLTSLVGFCPMYGLLGIDSCSKKS